MGSALSHLPPRGHPRLDPELRCQVLATVQDHTTRVSDHELTCHPSSTGAYLFGQHRAHHGCCCSRTRTGPDIRRDYLDCLLFDHAQILQDVSVVDALVREQRDLIVRAWLCESMAKQHRRRYNVELATGALRRPLPLHLMISLRLRLVSRPLHRIAT